MNLNWNIFQTILIIVFGFILFIAVLIFSGVIPGFRSPSGGSGGAVTLWGTIPEATASSLFSEFARQHEKEFTLTYVYHDPTTIEADLVDALASGVGPDLVQLPHEALWRMRNKLQLISYQSIPERQFLDTYVRGSSLYLDRAGIWGLPLTVDPLVLYYNPDLLAAAGYAAPPATWSELQTMAKTLSVADRSGLLSRSAIALGDFGNITRAKDILSLLILQTGNPITGYDDNNALKFTIAQTFGPTAPGTADALSFFTRFIDPGNSAYSWNTAQPEARTVFARGDSVFYLGLGSEAELLRRQNPQLPLDAALAPQTGTGARVDYGHFGALSITRGARNPNTALQVAELLTAADWSAPLARAANLAPVAAGALTRAPAEPVAARRERAALTARAWLDPNPSATENVLATMARAVSSGRAEPAAAVSAAQQQLQALVSQTQ